MSFPSQYNHPMSLYSLLLLQQRQHPSSAVLTMADLPPLPWLPPVQQQQVVNNQEEEEEEEEVREHQEDDLYVDDVNDDIDDHRRRSGIQIVNLRNQKQYQHQHQQRVMSIIDQALDIVSS